MKINLVIVDPKIEYGKILLQQLETTQTYDISISYFFELNALLNYLEGIYCDIPLISSKTKSISAKDKFLKWLNDNVSTLITQKTYMVYNKIKKRANFVDDMTLIGKIPIIYELSEYKIFEYIVGKEYIQI